MTKELKLKAATELKTDEDGCWHPKEREILISGDKCKFLQSATDKTCYGQRQTKHVNSQ